MEREDDHAGGYEGNWIKGTVATFGPTEYALNS